MNHPGQLCDSEHTERRCERAIAVRVFRAGSRSSAGYTLIEMLVATVVFVIFMVGILNLLDTSTKVSELEKALSDTQENVRFSAYHIMRTARMVGGGDMPFATRNGGTDYWVSGQLASNQSGSVTIPGYVPNVQVAEGSDVITLRGFFEVAPFFVDANGYNASGSGTFDINQKNPAGTAVNNFNALTVSGLAGRGIIFMGEGLYCVGEIASGSILSGSSPDQQLVLQHQAGDGTFWPEMNSALASYPPTFRVYRVGILESYTFYVRNDNTLMRFRTSDSSSGPEPVAVNIGSLQIALGVDTNGNGVVEAGEWENAPTGPGDLTGDQVIGMRITVLGRTPFPVPEWQEPAETFENIEDMEASDVDRSAKWRRIQLRATLRNFMI